MNDESDDSKNQNLSVEEYPNEIKPHLKNIVIDLRKSDTPKIQLTIAVNFISSKDTNEEQIMHSKTDNIEVMSYGSPDKLIEELFDSLLSKRKLFYL